jgi:thioredoxin 1
MNTVPPRSPELLVACLCADWCYICGEYRAVFESLRSGLDARAAFVWVDIEDDEEALGNVEVDDFPTYLIARGDTVMHFGPLIPRREAALRLVERALRGELAEIPDARLAQLAQRIRALADAKGA